jgi:hypothetical protein
MITPEQAMTLMPLNKEQLAQFEGISIEDAIESVHDYACFVHAFVQHLIADHDMPDNCKYNAACVAATGMQIYQICAQAAGMPDWVNDPPEESED